MRRNLVDRCGNGFQAAFLSSRRLTSLFRLLTSAHHIFEFHARGDQRQ
ncbi:MAG: hypothetical protein OJF51_003818 [Nitrospira sp.]|nr:MAG: hypothetical protein OJF51_003818 [Nitrospira sp.]